MTAPQDPRSLAWTIGAAIVVVLYVILLLGVESQLEIAGLLAAGIAAVAVAARFGVVARLGRFLGERDGLLNALVVAGVLLLVATVIIYFIACLGLNLQFGYSGVLNFAGAAFFGIGCYTAAVMTVHTAVPHLLILFAGGAMAAAIGSILILPVLRTYSHYSAVITIAFGLLFKIFLEVNDALGGPQGLRVKGMNVLGWKFNSNIDIGGIEVSFYVNYIVLGMVLLALAFTFVRRVERSWIGLNLDAVRLDETAAACFGLNITRWKITAFTLGNFLIGLAGALFAMMLGFIAPTNFTFGDSLILVSIVLLGGIGNPWGLVVATAILIVVPEKLQAIQEYRFLLFAAMVILILLFRPEGLLPRSLRTYLPGWRAK
ncbi:MAG: branched-chain amino acid ABC transporter permease [Rhodospirillales bacterium]|nr:branched-chain amino acid ABC transporter permease [Rhodospirillales bacterium]